MTIGPTPSSVASSGTVATPLNLTRSTSTMLCHGAVYGKADGQSTDYRWLELTEAALPSVDFHGLARLLSLGQENVDEGAYYAWRRFGTVYCAVRAYRSSARDAAGRSRIVEKAILFWQGDPALVPRVALGMFRKLSPEQFGSQWWSTRQSRNWEDREYHLPGTRHEFELPSQRDVDEVAAGYEDQGENWKKWLRPVGVSMAHASWPAILELPQRSPVPDFSILVALLDRLKHAGASSEISIAGWFPCACGSAGELTNWNIVIAENGRISGASNRASHGDPLVENELDRLFSPRVRPEFQRELSRFENPEWIADPNALAAQFPSLFPAELALLASVIDGLIAAKDRVPKYIAKLDQHFGVDPKLSALRRARIQTKVDRLNQYRAEVQTRR